MERSVPFVSAHGSEQQTDQAEEAEEHYCNQLRVFEFWN
jgi:hypothetical protein